MAQNILMTSLVCYLAAWGAFRILPIQAKPVLAFIGVASLGAAFWSGIWLIWM